MNLPNKLTVLRLIMTIVILVLLMFPFYAIGIDFPRLFVGGIYVKSQYLIAGGLFMLASLTDFLDGYIARKYNMITDTGKMLDAIADKALVNSVLVVLAAQGMVPSIIPVILILRDIVVNAIKMEAAAKGKVVAAIGSGKIKTACLMIGTVLSLFYNLPFELWNFQIADFLLYFAAVMSIFSAYEYFRLNKQLIFPKKQNDEIDEL